jgi:hypothetical protein
MHSELRQLAEMFDAISEHWHGLIPLAPNESAKAPWLQISLPLSAPFLLLKTK